MTGGTPRRHTVPDRVAWTRHAPPGAPPRVFVAPLPQGPIHVLEGSSAVIWEQALHGEATGLPGRVAQVMGEPVDMIRGEVEAFVSHLVESGLLA